MDTGERTRTALVARRDDLMRELARADAICRRGEADGTHRPSWDDKWIGLLREYEAVEDALAGWSAPPRQGRLLG